MLKNKSITIIHRESASFDVSFIFLKIQQANWSWGRGEGGGLRLV